MISHSQMPMQFRAHAVTAGLELVLLILSGKIASALNIGYGLDAVIIGSPNAFHVDSAIPALDKGLTILLEKPVATSLEDCAKLWQAYIKADCPPLAVGFVLRYTPFYSKVKELIAQGAVGQVLSIEAAEDNFSCFDTPFCLVGHSHVPLVFEFVEGVAIYRGFPDDDGLQLGNNRLIINPGGVGQPRDGDPRASYAIYDDKTSIIHHYRVEYDILATQSKMEERGLPASLIKRLSHGL